jgi:methylglutaconyl-CoA hydratase/polyketide biosynthesis enoyl-CoA hydratase PksH
MELITQAVRHEIISGVAHITLSSPKSGNALSISLLEHLTQSLKEAEADDSCRVILLQAEGDDFCKGLNLEAAFTKGDKLDLAICQKFLNCLALICTSRKPVIAFVEGNVTGGGVGLVAACDLVIASEHTVFMLPEVLVGMIPALIVPFLLRRMTLGRVKYMTLSTRGIPASEAQVFGLVDEVARDEIAHTLNKQLQRLFRASPHALAESKRYCERLQAEELNQQLEIALDQLSSWLDQPDVVGGIRAFAEGFSPPWFQKYRGDKNV